MSWIHRCLLIRVTSRARAQRMPPMPFMPPMRFIIFISPPPFIFFIMSLHLLELVEQAVDFLHLHARAARRCGACAWP